MKSCKTCKGKGWISKTGEVFTGKYDRFFGMEIPITTMGKIKRTCPSCYGRGLK